MKIIKIILLGILLLSAVPIDSFCADSHSQNETHQCVIACHATCCQSATSNHSAFSLSLPSQSTSFSLHENASHESPFLSTS